MSFCTVEFLVFFVLVYGLYRILPHKAQNRLLLAASYFFYGYWDWRFLSLLLISTTVDYFCGLKIFSSSNPKAKRRYLMLSLTVNLSLLGFFKYFNFFVKSFCGLWEKVGIPLDIPALNIILPIGISFYTFQTLSYTIDVFRGEIKPTRDFWDFALFVSFFPQLVAGPIERARHLLPQFSRPRTVLMPGLREGALLIFWGVFEKLFVANNMARLVDPVFANLSQVSPGDLWVALYAFSFQIFADFDGYSNIARGLSLCMGFDIMQNFDTPYFSLTPSEFWKRWHISLSSWLRDYLYIPLGGNRCSRLRNAGNLFIVMLLGGLWHGANSTFLVWGFYHALLLVVYRPFICVINKWGNRSILGKLGLMVVLFHLVTLGWVFFRAESLAQAGQALGVLSRISWVSLRNAAWLPFLGFVTPILFVDSGAYRTGQSGFFLRGHWVIRTFIFALMAYLLLGWGVFSNEEFIYFQF